MPDSGRAPARGSDAAPPARRAAARAGDGDHRGERDGVATRRAAHEVGESVTGERARGAAGLASCRA